MKNYIVMMWTGLVSQVQSPLKSREYLKQPSDYLIWSITLLYGASYLWIYSECNICKYLQRVFKVRITSQYYLTLILTKSKYSAKLLSQCKLRKFQGSAPGHNCNTLHSAVSTSQAADATDFKKK